jgi:hypothetical protein
MDVTRSSSSKDRESKYERYRIHFVVGFHFGISWLNAWSVGKTWVESKAEGGFSYAVTWCALIMSASGFTWCYTILLALLAGNIPYHGHVLLAPKYVNGAMELGYLVVILPILGSGLTWLVIIVIAALVGGCLTTFAIVKRSAKVKAFEVRYELEDAKKAA